MDRLSPEHLGMESISMYPDLELNCNPAEQESYCFFVCFFPIIIPFDPLIKLFGVYSLRNNEKKSDE